MILIAPQDLELKYLRTEKKVHGLLAQNFFWSSLLIGTVLAILVGFAWLLLQSPTDYLILNGFRNLQLLTYNLHFFALLSIMVLLTSSELRSWLLTAFAVVTWGSLVYFLTKMNANWTTHKELFLFVPFLYLFVYLTNRLKPHFAFILVSFFFWSGYLYIILNKDRYIPDVLTYFYDLKLPFLWIFISYFFIYRPKNTKIDFSILVNPIHILRGTLWPRDTGVVYDQSKLKTIWMQGLLNLILAYILFDLRLLLDMALNFNSKTSLINVIFVQNLRLLTDVAFCNVLTGIARMIGFKVPDATSFVFLSKTPAEFWRRGSVYTFQFVLHFIYLPIVRNLKTPVLALFIGFLFFYFNRVGLQNFSNLELTKEVKIASLVFIFYFLSILISQRYWFISNSKLQIPKYAWLSIFLTHTTNISLVTLARIIGNWI